MPHPILTPTRPWLGARLDAVARRLQRSTGRMWRAGWRWWKDRPLLLAAALALGAYGAKELLDPAVDLAAAKLSIGKLKLLAGVIALAGAVALVSLLLRLLRPPRPDPVGKPPERLTLVARLSRSDIAAVQRDVIEPLFPGDYPDEDELYAMYARNPGMGIALYSEDLDRFVSFACAWPLRVSAAEALIKGAMVENDLAARDVLPAERNHLTRYLLVPVIATIDHDTPAGTWRTRTLQFRFVEMIRRTFWRDGDDRAITFIATGYSRQGVDLCDLQSMATGRHVTMGGRNMAVRTRAMTRDQVQVIG